MSFLFPGFFWALSLLSIPIIVHLLNLRSYKTVYFSNVAFLSKLQKESKTRTELKKWLILLIRLLALTSLIIAFAYPVKKQAKMTKASRQSKVILFVDNSMSMTAGSNYGKNLDFAKRAAKKIVASYAENTLFALITANFKKISNFENKANLLKELSETESFAIPVKLSQVFKKIINLSQQDSSQFFQIYLLSDFQKYTSDIKIIANRKNYKINILNFSLKKKENISIDSVWTDNLTHLPFQKEQLFIRLKNYGQKLAQNIHLKVFINDSLETFSTFSINSRSYKTVSLVYQNPENGAIWGRISINDYSILFDNQFYFSYYIKPKIRVAYYSPTKNEDFIPQFYSDTTFFSLKIIPQSKNIVLNDFSSYDLVILDQISVLNSKWQNKLKEILKNGINLVLIPSRNIQVGDFNSLFKQLNSSLILGVDTSHRIISSLDMEHPIFKSSVNKKSTNIALPYVNYHYLFSVDRENDNSLLKFSETTAVKEVSYKNAKLYAFSFPLNDKTTNLGKNPLISPLFFNIAFLNRQSATIFHRLSWQSSLEIPLNFNSEADNPLILNKRNSENGFIPQWQKSYDGQLFLNLYSQLQQVGLYELKYKQKLIYPLAFDYVRRESETEFYTNAALKKIFKEKNWTNFTIFDAEKLQNKNTKFEASAQIKYWCYFVMIAFILLLGETLLLKFWKD